MMQEHTKGKLAFSTKSYYKHCTYISLEYILGRSSLMEICLEPINLYLLMGWAPRLTKLATAHISKGDDANSERLNFFLNIYQGYFS